MTGQRAVEPPIWGRGHKPFMKRLQHLWTLLNTEEVFREDGTSARRAMVRRAIRS